MRTAAELSAENEVLHRELRLVRRQRDDLNTIAEQMLVDLRTIASMADNSPEANTARAAVDRVKQASSPPDAVWPDVWINWFSDPRQPAAFMSERDALEAVPHACKDYVGTVRYEAAAVVVKK